MLAKGMEGPTLDDGLDEVVAAIRLLGSLRRPHEACGLIVPRLGVAPKAWVHELPNVTTTDPTDSYAIGRSSLFGLWEELKKSPFTVSWDALVIWHTHPGGGVGPSKMDMQTKLAEFDYLVVTLPDGPAVRF